MPIQALILLAILAASAVVFTVVFVIVADRQLARPADGEANEARADNDDETGGGRVS